MSLLLLFGRTDVTVSMAVGTATGAGLGPTITLWQPHAQPCYVLMIDKGTVGCPIISVSTMTAVMINDGRTRAVKV